MRIKSTVKSLVFRWRNLDLFDDDLQRCRLQSISQIFHGKRVALVGNAQSIFDRSDGDAIDGHDIVVRLNRGLVVDSRSQGSRTDVLCLANALSTSEVLQLFGSPQVIWVTPKRELMDPSMIGQVPCFPLSDWKRLHKILSGWRPSAGLITLYMLQGAAFSPARISLFGFDWKHTKTFYHDKNNMRSWHDWDRERILIESWLATDQRLVLRSDAKPTVYSLGT